jgi:hypothetical protein
MCKLRIVAPGLINPKSAAVAIEDAGGEETACWK